LNFVLDATNIPVFWMGLSYTALEMTNVPVLWMGLSYTALETTNIPVFWIGLSYLALEMTNIRLCPYNCVKEKSNSHPHDTIILDQQNFVGGNENDSTQFYLKLRRTKRTNY